MIFLLIIFYSNLAFAQSNSTQPSLLASFIPLIIVVSIGYFFFKRQKNIKKKYEEQIEKLKQDFANQKKGADIQQPIIINNVQTNETPVLGILCIVLGAIGTFSGAVLSFFGLICGIFGLFKGQYITSIIGILICLSSVIFYMGLITAAYNVVN